MTTPLLSFKSGDSNVSISPRSCLSTSWPNGLTYTYTPPGTSPSVLVGINASPYYYDSQYVTTDRSTCNNKIWGNINDVFYRNIQNPTPINRITNTSGIRVLKDDRINRLSCGFSDGVNFTSNIFNPSLNGKKFYAIAEIETSSNTSIPCVTNNCQSVDIKYTLRNIFNPRDTIIQTVGYVPTSSLQTVNKIIAGSTKESFLTQLTVNYSPPADGYGFGTFIDAKGKTIEMTGVTNSNIVTFKKDPLVSIIYDRKCLNWEATPYVFTDTGTELKFVKNPSVFQPPEVILREKTRASTDILYSDYFEIISKSKKVRYFEVVMPSINLVLAELYATIDISEGSPVIKLWSSWKAGDSNYKSIRSGFDTNRNTNYLMRELDQPFIADMPLVWGQLPDLKMIDNFTGMNLNGIDIESFGKDYFMMLGDYGLNNKRFAVIFTPKSCSNISVCSNKSDCKSNEGCVDNFCKEIQSKKTNILIPIIIGVVLIILIIIYTLFRKRK